MSKNDVASGQGRNGNLLGINEESEAQLKDEERKKPEKSCPLCAPVHDITALPASIKA